MRIDGRFPISEIESGLLESALAIVEKHRLYRLATMSDTNGRVPSLTLP